jgi:hypothetical protein
MAIKQILGDYININGKDCYIPPRCSLSLSVCEKQDWLCNSCKSHIYIRYTHYFTETIFGDSGNGKMSDLHHKDRNRSNNSLNNLEQLCQKCHHLLHRHQKQPQMKMAMVGKCTTLIKPLSDTQCRA